MPRRNRREPVPAPGEEECGFLDGIQERILGSPGSRLEGFEVRSVVNKAKRYKCPYCGGWVEPGTHHMVAVPSGRPEARRHYHSGCWTKQVNGSRPPGSGAGR